MSPEDVEKRLSRLEQDVARLQEQQALTASDATAARALAAGADRDVPEVRSELRAFTLALDALRQTQLEHGQRLDRVDARFDGMEHRFDLVDAGLQQIVALLTEQDRP